MPDVRNEIIDNLQVRGSIGGGMLGSLRQAIRIAMTVATSGSTGIRIAKSSNTTVGTSDFTVHVSVRLPSFAVTGGTGFYFDYTDASNFWYVGVNTGGVARIFVRLSGSTLLDTSAVITDTTGRTATFTYVVARETATTAGSVSFYLDRVLLGSSTIAAGSPSSYPSGTVYLLGTNSIRLESDTLQAILYNRALSAAEVLSLYNNGPALADLGASQAAAFEGDFSSGAGGVTNRNSVTVAGNIDAIGGEDNWLRLTATGSSPNAQVSALTRAAPGLRARLTLRLFVPSGNPAATGVSFRDSAVNPITGLQDFQPATDVVTDFVAEFTTTTSSSNFIVYLRSAASVTGGLSGDIVYIKILRIQYLGITGWWDARDAQSDTGQILDSSGNKNHAMLPASGATVIGKPLSEARQVRWTNTWTGTNELQYIGGVNQAVLPAKAYIESIVGIVSGATVEDIIIGDGSDTDRYVALTTGLAAGTVTFTLANRTTDGTNLKLTVDPDADATMSIIWTVTYRILE